MKGLVEIFVRHFRFTDQMTDFTSFFEPVGLSVLNGAEIRTVRIVPTNFYIRYFYNTCSYSCIEVLSS